MAIGGGASPAYEWIVMDNQLHEGRYHPMTMVTLTKLDEIVDALSHGRTVYVSARADVREAVREELRRQGVQA
jgi:hypothetical protein